MAFATTLGHKSVEGDLIVSYGTYTNSGGGTGGDINTGTDRCLFIKLQSTGATTPLTVPSINETMPCAGKAVTVVTAADDVGIWIAIGEGVGY